MHKRKITYKEVKSKQQGDLDSNISKYYIYRHFSTPFTWAFVKLGISPNKITILSFLLCFIGFYFLSQGTYAFLLLGLLFFALFKILDMSDGEVARIQNTASIEGLYFDRISHYIYSVCFGLGLGFGLYRLYQNDIYLILGFVFTFVFILENAISDLLKALSRETIINKKISIKLHTNNKQNIAEHFQKRLMDKISGGKSFGKRNIFSRLVGIYPSQGVIYTDTFTGPIFIILTVVEYFLSMFANFPVIFGYSLGIIPAYAIIVSLSKTIWIVHFIYKMEIKRYITATLK